MAYIDQHAVPVRITQIEHLPNLTATGAHDSAAQTLARYKVSTESAGSPTVKIIRIVDYNTGTGELALEPSR